MKNVIKVLSLKNHERKRLFLHIFIRFAAVVLLCYSMYNIFYKEYYLLGSVELLSISFMMYILHVLKTDIVKASRLFHYTLLLSIITLTALAPTEKYDSIWALIVPLSSFFLLGTRKGRFCSSAFFVYIVVSLNYFVEVPNYYYVINIMLAYLVIAWVLFLYEKNNEDYKEENSALVEELQEKNALLQTLSTTDALTSLYNRAKIDSIIEHEVQRARRYANYFSIILIDIDYFKAVNDTHGHQAGDTILKEFSEVLLCNIRTIDSVARWGGEEFLVLLPSTPHEGALIVAEKIRSKVEEREFSYKFSNSCSVGVASFSSKNDTEDFLLERADKALYVAKKEGRNKVVSEEVM